MKSYDTDISLNWWQVWKLRRIAWRNRIFARKSFQDWASRLPLVRRIARKRAQRVFDLLAGFTYSQTLLACVESGLLDLLGEGVSGVDRIAKVTGLPAAAAERLVRAATGIGIAEEVAPRLWMLGREGAGLINNAGARAMIRHHSLLYQDLADPLALLRADRASPTRLSEFWRYAASADAGAETTESVAPYSELMAASQAMVSEQVLGSYGFSETRKLLDIGGGFGVFAHAVRRAHPEIEVGVFDLPGVVQGGADQGGDRIARHAGDFFRDPLPRGYDTISLTRILHDHDDGPALKLLHAIREALPSGGRLIIAEPMAKVRGAEPMGETYFGLYLWAMRSGRPRSVAEIQAMLQQAGFQGSDEIATQQPMITSLIVARA